ncbi:AAA family ATPase [Stenotrophomonas acidaminiphila]|uniref:AAA family ATPase n=1 Tax=Stenotrophomonas acidaminiphila TaxID=128780 RepID=UPI0024ADC936|nr:AAA family ATPase [Stenotrophomonas acidaminiphila]WHL17958.1 AAA family ATPase [Stenotrophomonas acidaminiphila]
MKQILYNNLPLEESARGKVTLILGENGSGKSRELGRLASTFDSRGVATIAISNTVFDRFPAKKTRNYARLTPSVGRGYVQRALKQALFTGNDERRDARQVARVFQYAGFDQVIGIAPIWRSFDLSQVMDAIWRDHRISERDAPVIAKFIDSLLIDRSESHAEPYWYGLEDDAPRYESAGLAVLVRNETALKKLKVLSRVEFFLRKNGEVFPLIQASSGELTLIATYAFLATRMEEGAVILVDEPENSLHPRWQSEYCDRLFDLFHLYEPSIFLASHSPLIVSGAESKSIATRIVTLTATGSSNQADNEVKSIDGILLEAFGVLAPASHYLSELVTTLLNDILIQKKTLRSVESELRHLWLRSYDAKQREFLRGAINLAKTVAREALKSGGRDEG